MQNILIAYDGSEFANKAFAMALEMARKFHSELYIISIARPPEIWNSNQLRDSDRLATRLQPSYTTCKY